jgi:putative intracellular protease/amidase
MPRGLEGKRVALYASTGEGSGRGAAAAVVDALEKAGARVHLLRAIQSAEDWHGAKYAVLVLIGDAGSEFATDPKLSQLVREFLVSEKPVAVLGSAIGAILEAGGIAGRTVAASGRFADSVKAAGGTVADPGIAVDGSLISATTDSDPQGFAARIVKLMGAHIEERAVDEMSDQSFPASDPPATNPGSVGHVAPDDDHGTTPRPE